MAIEHMGILGMRWGRKSGGKTKSAPSSHRRKFNVTKDRQDVGRKTAVRVLGAIGAKKIINPVCINLASTGHPFAAATLHLIGDAIVARTVIKGIIDVSNAHTTRVNENGKTIGPYNATKGKKK